LLLFARAADVKENGVVEVPGCAITLLDEACMDRPLPGSKISVLYYQQYTDRSRGIGIFATTDKTIVDGIQDGYFATKSAIKTESDSEAMGEEDVEEEEVFCDAVDDLSKMLPELLSPQVSD
uniref:Ku domain-containing protein n=1 Tax=Gongylonema pulchrum TaxID=637853 RepID=A0A183ERN7_9BILA